MNADPEAPRPTLGQQAVAGRRGAVLAGSGLACIVLFGFLLALGAQFERYMEPKQPIVPEAPGAPVIPAESYSFDALHGDSAEEAISAWNSGAERLQEFNPVAPVTLVRVHVIVDFVFALALLVFLWLLIDRLEAPRWLRWVALVGFVADVVEGGLEWWLTWRPGADVAFLFGPLAFLKILAPAFVLLFALWWSWGRLGDGWRVYRTAPATARLIMWASIGFIAATSFGDIGAQAEDALRREIELIPWPILRVFLPLMAYLVVLAIVRDIAVPPGETPAPRTLFGLGALSIGIGLLTTYAFGGGSAPLGLGLILIVVAILSRVADDAEPPRDAEPPADDDPDGQWWLYVIAAVVPPTALALLAARLLAGEIASSGGWPQLLAAQIVLLVLAVGVGWWFLSPSRLVGSEASTSRPQVAVLAAVAAIALAFALANLLGPTLLHLGWVPDFSRWVLGGIGAFAVLLSGLAAFAATCGLARLFAADWDRPTMFARMRMARTPVISLLLIWFLLVNIGTVRLERQHRSPHVVRMTTALQAEPAACSDETLAALGPETVDHQDVADALCSWIERNALVGDGGDDSPVPMVLVTASGGGVRAAVWTARVLDCLFLPAGRRAEPCGENGTTDEVDGDPWARLFAASGASGGSVGLASAVGQRIAPVATGDDWVHTIGQRDHVGPTLGHMVLAEMPLAPAGLAPGHDRAEVLIDSWVDPFGEVEACSGIDGSLDDTGFLSVRQVCPDQVPLLLLNGTVVATGQRFDISPLTSLGEKSVDLREVLCPDEDPLFFDAAFLSARFPLVTPSGRLVAKSGSDCEDRPVGSGVDVVDGGYLENSGTAQMTDLLGAIRPLLASYEVDRPDGYRAVEPMVVRIVNGEVATSGPEPDPDDGLASQLGEPLRIPQAKLRADGQPTEDSAVHALRDAAPHPDIPIVEFHLYPHPGGRLPLGWALTEPILNDIDRVFRLGPNQEAACEVAELLLGADGDPEKCSEAT